MNTLFFCKTATTNLLIGKLLTVIAVVAAMTASNASAQILTFDFEGTITENDLGLFAGKPVGDVFSGSFTVDTNATQTADHGTAADYDGSTFDVTIEGDSYGVTVLTVFSTGSDGVEFDTDPFNGSVLGFLALRSTADILSTNAVPASYDIADFDSFARVTFFDFQNFEFSIGEITNITPRGTAPTVTCPTPVTSQCNAPSTREVTLTVDLEDADGDLLDVEWFVDGDLKQATIGTSAATDSFTHTFGLGESVVEVFVDDGTSEVVNCSTTVTIVDTEDPVAICAADVVGQTDPGECEATGVVLPEPVATDNCEVDTLSNDAPETFSLGETTVTWTVTDVGGNSATCTQLVTIEDLEKPSITCPPDVTVDHDAGACGATGVSLGTPTTSDNCGIQSVSSDAPATFLAGETYVTWTVTDDSGNYARCTQVVSVNNADPVADAGSDGIIECTSSSGAEATLDATASFDPDSGDILTYNWSAVGITFDDDTSPTPTGTFPLGSTTVTLVVSDQCGAMNSKDVIIVVEDSIAPQIEIVFADKQMLWPPNHKMVPVQISMGVRDTCVAPEQLIVSCMVWSSEPDEANGDGNSTGDVNGADGYSAGVPITMTWNASTALWEGSLELRAERDGRNENRKYSFDCLVGDASGNVSNATLCIVVPHSKKK